MARKNPARWKREWSRMGDTERSEVISGRFEVDEVAPRILGPAARERAIYTARSWIEKRGMGKVDTSNARPYDRLSKGLDPFFFVRDTAERPNGRKLHIILYGLPTRSSWMDPRSGYATRESGHFQVELHVRKGSRVENHSMLYNGNKIEEAARAYKKAWQRLFRPGTAEANARGGHETNGWIGEEFSRPLPLDGPRSNPARWKREGLTRERAIGSHWEIRTADQLESAYEALVSGIVKRGYGKEYATRLATDRLLINSELLGDQSKYTKILSVYLASKGPVRISVKAFHAQPGSPGRISDLYTGNDPREAVAAYLKYYSRFAPKKPAGYTDFYARNYGGWIGEQFSAPLPLDGPRQNPRAWYLQRRTTKPGASRRSAPVPSEYPTILQRFVVRVYDANVDRFETKQEALGYAFAVAVSKLQDAGYIELGTRNQLTAAGMQKDASYSSEERANAFTAYRAILASARSARPRQ